MTDQADKMIYFIRDRLVSSPQPCTSVPNSYWITFNNYQTPTDTMLYSPIGGYGWICYEWAGSATAPTLTLYVNDGSGYQPQVLETGQTTFQANGDFFLYYDVGSSGAAIKLGYAVS